MLGFQEVQHHQLLDLANLLPEYAFVGVGRDDGKEAGEVSASCMMQAGNELMQSITGCTYLLQYVGYPSVSSELVTNADPPVDLAADNASIC